MNYDDMVDKAAQAYRAQTYVAFKRWEDLLESEREFFRCHARPILAAVGITEKGRPA